MRYSIKIFSIQFLAIFGVFTKEVNAQNKPNLSIVSPSGTITNPLLELPPNYTIPSSPKFNFTRAWIPQTPISNSSLINSSSSSSQVSQVTDYTDGLGASIQTISRFGTSKTNHSISVIDPRFIGNESYQFLSYSVNQTSGINFRSNVFTEQNTFYTSLYPNEGNTAYSKMTSEYSSSILKSMTYSPGKSQVGQMRGVEKYSEQYSGNDIVRLGFQSGNPVFDGFFGSNELYVEISKGQHNQEARKYFDKDGKLIATGIMSDISSSFPIEYTYYVYDDYDRVVITITPKATKMFNDISWNFSSSSSNTILDDLCIRTAYDEFGRTISSSSPEKDGNSYVVYDKYDRPVLSQDPNLTNQHKWMFTVYDEMSRVTFSGILNSTENREYWQYILDETGTAPTTIPSSGDLSDNSKIYTYLINGIQSIQGTQTYPSSITNAEILKYNYYDHYDYTDLNAFTFNTEYLSRIYPDVYYNTYGTNSALRTMTTKGFLIGTKEKVIKNPSSSSILEDWTTQIFYYNDNGQIIQNQRIISKTPMVSSNEISNSIHEISTTMYDFKGRILRTVLENKNYIYHGTSPSISSTGSTHFITQKYKYEENTFKLLSIQQKINNQDWILISSNEYDSQTGMLLNKKIGDVEIQHYNYSIRGQLTGINAAYAESGIQQTKVTFGESIKYDYGFTTPRYDGNISGIIWKTPSVYRRAYGYGYTESNRLEFANFNELKVNGIGTIVADWDANVTDYSVTELDYDQNGNILNLTRMGMDNSFPSVPIVTDNLTYRYESSDVSNRLSKVDDASTYSPVVGNKEQDFQNHNSGSDDYTYDKNGNMTSDKNKYITSIEYNYLNKPIKVVVTDPNPSIGTTTIEYIYTASGEKLEEITTSIAGTDKRTFIGCFVYNNEELQLLHHAEGRARFNIDNNIFNYDFYVKDHLGNVRTILAAEEVPFTDYLAQHEIALANVENLIFDNIEETREDRPDQSSGNESAALLNASDPERRIGTAVLLHVMAGDKFNLESLSYYYGNDSTGSTGTVEGADMLSSIIETLLSGESGFNQGEGNNSAQITNALFNSANYIDLFQQLKEQSTNPLFPKAYLNYLVFDERMNLISNQSGAIQVTQPDTWNTLETLNDIQIEQGGYLAVYISNESYEHNVYFDNLRLRFFRGRLLEENHYYPFGMAIRISSDVSIAENKNLYQTKEFNSTANINQYDFLARQYDPLLGRFTGPDAAGQFASGYVGMGNNPTAMIDPDGNWANMNASSGRYDWGNHFRLQNNWMKRVYEHWGRQKFVDIDGSSLKDVISILGMDMTDASAIFNEMDRRSEDRKQESNLNRMRELLASTYPELATILKYCSYEIVEKLYNGDYSESETSIDLEHERRLAEFLISKFSYDIKYLIDYGRTIKNKGGEFCELGLVGFVDPDQNVSGVNYCAEQNLTFQLENNTYTESFITYSLNPHIDAAKQVLIHIHQYDERTDNIYYLRDKKEIMYSSFSAADNNHSFENKIPSIMIDLQKGRINYLMVPTNTMQVNSGDNPVRGKNYAEPTFSWLFSYFKF
ncbi:MAG: hypothetical protein IPI46_13860 [Bacteroidetes bacterium]|nr:hypothetical protein [Bacteroidota bacterium]